jgi:hypothetical protein
MGIDITSLGGDVFMQAVGLIGDGHSASIDIDLDVAPAPFRGTYQGAFPSRVYLSSVIVSLGDGSADPTFSATVSMVHRSVMRISFNKPLAAAPSAPPQGFGGVGFAQVVFYFIF